MEIKRTKLYKWLKRNQTIYFLKCKLTDRDYQKQKKTMSGSSVKSKEQIKCEMELCRNYWHCDPAHYVRYGLFEKKLSNEELLDYIPPYYHYNFYMADKYVGIDTAYYSNKQNLYHLFTKCGIPTPRVIAMVNRGELQTLQGELLPIKEFISCLSKGKKYFFKPVDGAGGTGIEVLKNNQLEACVTFMAMLNKKSVYVIQEGITQRNDFQKINPSSVNTLRVITQHNGENPRISVCVMRIGRDGKDVDNSHQGGMSCQINLTDGTLNGTATAEHGGGTYFEHPDSGFIFKGKRIEGWEGIKSSVLSYACNFPELKEIGWDIAVTEKGITVLELNVNYGIDHLQCCCGGMRRKLNVYPSKKN